MTRENMSPAEIVKKSTECFKKSQILLKDAKNTLKELKALNLRGKQLENIRKTG